MALVLTPVANLAVVRDNVGGMDTSVSQEGNTPNGGATEDQILEGYGAYVNGQLVEGNIPTANVTDTTINNLNDTVTIPGHTYINENLTIGLSSSFLKDATSGATATANKMLQGETAYVDGELVTGTIPSLAAKTYTPGTTNQTIASGKYLSGTQTIKGDANLKSTNIKAGTTIFGVTGNSNVVDTAAGTATAAQILKDKVAYVDGKKITGSMNSYSNKNVNVSSVESKEDYTEITLPEDGYYTQDTKLLIDNSILKKEVISTVLADASNLKTASLTVSGGNGTIRDTGSSYYTTTSATVPAFTNNSYTSIYFIPIGTTGGEGFGGSWVSSPMVLNKGESAYVSCYAGSYNAGTIGSSATRRVNVSYCYIILEK